MYVLVLKALFRPELTCVLLTDFNNSQSVALTVFGITAGIILRFVHRYKWLQVTGLAIRLVYARFLTPLNQILELDLDFLVVWV